MLDCSIIKCANNLNLISSTDYFYPLVADPYVQGRIGATNVISDIYSLGIPNIDNILMILAASTDIKNKQHRNIITSEMISGFIDSCFLAKTRVTGGHSVNNPWPIIGGCAQTVVTDEQFISPFNGQCGDYLVLTKPLGTQLTVNMDEWKSLNDEKYKQVISENVIDDGIIDKIANIGKGSMMKLNRNAAVLMISDKYKQYVNGATDVTGFGILGHAQNLAVHQYGNRGNDGDGLQLVIDRLPVIKYSNIIDKFFDGMFNLEKGFAAETSGGLLVMISDKYAANDFIEELWELDGWPSWIIGKVRKYDCNDTITMSEAAIIDDNFEFIEVYG